MLCCYVLDVCHPLAPCRKAVERITVAVEEKPKKELVIEAGPGTPIGDLENGVCVCVCVCPCGRGGASVLGTRHCVRSNVERY